jgi:FkbM family methyltransferase
MELPMPESFRKAHFTLRHRLIAAVSTRLDGITYTQRHGLIRGLKRKGGLGFLPAMLGGATYDSPEHRFLRSLDLRDLVVYEIGAFQGILTLFWSGRARAVIAYEPNPASYRRVLENLRLNGRTNVRVRNLAVGDREDTITLLCDPLMPGGATGDPSLADQIQGTSPSAAAVDVRVVTIDDDMAGAQLPPPDLVKIDIEGMELAALRGMTRTLRRHRPDLYLEMHGASVEHKDRNARAIVDFLGAHGYADILHVESGERVTRDNATRARAGHLYGRARSAEL